MDAQRIHFSCSALASEITLVQRDTLSDCQPALPIRLRRDVRKSVTVKGLDESNVPMWTNDDD